jgi:myo-inositol 2-dehydrogenase/D-chiro-inositol 1-dehydrogenase/scyllo-inositol 2-dehydrogenase (NAD+)
MFGLCGAWSLLGVEVVKNREFFRRELGKPIRLGLIGCGSIAQESHLPAIKKTPEVSLVAVADVNMSKARQVGKMHRVNSVYDNYRQLLQNDEIDAVDICTPTKYHAEIAIAAAKEGKHVLCEKPIALRLQDADRMIQTCSKYKVKLMIGHSRRFIPRYSIVKKIIERGQIGKPIWAIQISRRSRLEPKCYTWYFDPKMTYGPILEVGIHEADLLRWFFEDEVAEVRAIAKSRTSSVPLYDQVFASLKFKHGGVAGFEVGYILPRGFNQYTTLEVRGPKGWISASDSHMNTVVHGSRDSISYPRAYKDLLSVPSAYKDEIAAFAKAIIKGTDPPVTGSEGRSALEIVLALLSSIKSGTACKLPLREDASAL